jgi:hypothetical protein
MLDSLALIFVFRLALQRKDKLKSLNGCAARYHSEIRRM